ncbi:UDP-glucose 4-epimerase [Bacteroidales bacterium Barb7]|nr:UDP-glucose 4-epimerase [Bacteroidales bacterium Barb7]
MSKILITGVCGFIGSYLAKKLIALNHQIVGIDNLSIGSFLNIKEFENHISFSFYNINILENNDLFILFENYSFDYVFHLAALPRVSYSFIYPQETFNTNVHGTKNMVNISLKFNVKKFVFASSSSVYGIQNDTVLRESHVPNPISPYAKQKYMAEKYIIKKCKDENFSAIILRFFNVYGFSYSVMNEFSTIVPRCIESLINNIGIIIHNGGNQQRDFTYIDDVVNALIRSIEVNSLSFNGTAINVGRGEKHTINYVFEYICKQLNKKLQPTYKKLSYNEPNFTCADITKARRLLKWTPNYSFEEGVNKTIVDCLNREKIVIAMPLHNGAKTIRRAISSFVNQKNIRRKLILVIGNDHSTDEWMKEINDLITENIIIQNIHGGKSYIVRNKINDYILNNIKNVSYIGRLDADDELADEFIISKLEKIMDEIRPDVILAGNYIRTRNKIIKRVNIADKSLLDISCLLGRLRKMSLCVPEAELPSCNTFIKPECMITYPPEESAEDHWFTVELILKSNVLKIHVAENLLYSIYSLSGNLTELNKEKDKYINSRKKLYEYLRDKI